jgi:Zn-dependent membrane protease YugP
MQDAEEYFPLKFRSALVPIVNIGSNLGWFLIMIGFFLRFTELAWLGVIDLRWRRSLRPRHPARGI